jgi:hypothetical protein
MVSCCVAQQPIPTARFGLPFVPVISGTLIEFHQSVVDFPGKSPGRVDGIVSIHNGPPYDQVVRAGTDRFGSREGSSLIVSRIVAGSNPGRDD